LLRYILAFFSIVNFILTMPVTRSPVSGGQNRSFSGPHTSDAGASTSGDAPPAVQSEEAVERAKGAQSDASDAESLVDVTTTETDGSMETSSDGGSTVRELNRQLLTDDDDGNDGKVSEKDDGDDDDGFEQPRGKRGKRFRKSEESKSVSSNDQSAKKSRVEVYENLDVFIKGVGFSIAKEANRQPIEFNRRLCYLFGKVHNVKLTNDCVRVTCYSTKQKGQLLNHTDWYGKEVTVSEPWRKSRVSERPGNLLRRGIIFGVSAELTEHEIATEIQAETSVAWPDGIAAEIR